MTREAIPFNELRANPHRLWSEQWLALACGDFASGRFNAMTVAWGSLGTMWNRPFVQVVVRPVRHTYQFMERYDTFTLSAFAEQHRAALQLLGSKSGRDINKIAAAGLTPIASARIAAPGFAEAELILECRKMYYADFDPAHFLLPDILANYPQKDYHRMYFGEIVAVWGEKAYGA